jgi:putative transposase
VAELKNRNAKTGCHGRSGACPCSCSEPSMDNVPRKKVHHINLPGHAHELTFSCYRRLPLLTRNIPCRWLIEAIDTARKKHHYSLLAYVIMPEHVHIIVYPQDVHHDMAWFLKSIKQSVSRKAHTWLAKHDQHWLERLTVPGEDKFRFWQAGGGYDRNIEKHGTLRYDTMRSTGKLRFARGTQIIMMMACVIMATSRTHCRKKRGGGKALGFPVPCTAYLNMSSSLSFWY